MPATPSKVVLSVFHANLYPILSSFDQVSLKGSALIGVQAPTPAGKANVFLRVKAKR